MHPGSGGPGFYCARCYRPLAALRAYDFYRFMPVPTARRAVELTDRSRYMAAFCAFKQEECYMADKSKPDKFPALRIVVVGNEGQPHLSFFPHSSSVSSTCLPSGSVMVVLKPCRRRLLALSMAACRVVNSPRYVPMPLSVRTACTMYASPPPVAGAMSLAARRPCNAAFSVGQTVESDQNCSH